MTERTKEEEIDVDSLFSLYYFYVFISLSSLIFVHSFLSLHSIRFKSFRRKRRERTSVSAPSFYSPKSSKGDICSFGGGSRPRLPRLLFQRRPTQRKKKEKCPRFRRPRIRFPITNDDTNNEKKNKRQARKEKASGSFNPFSQKQTKTTKKSIIRCRIQTSPSLPHS